MTQEEKKLKKLLEIASANGWWEELDFHAFAVYPSTAECNFMGITSLNDIVTNFEEGEVSFIKMLCYQIKQIDNKHFSRKTLEIAKLNIYSLDELCIIEWDSKPTSQRLEWLFKTFNHLIE